MGTSLTGLTPSTTYDALIKVGDNGALSATSKYIGDGLGNDSVLSLSTTKVGIGTSAPTSLLTLSGTSEATPSSTTGGILNVIGSSTNALIIGSLSGSPFGMYIQGGGSGIYPLLLNPQGGDVSIGTTSPTARLHIKGSGATSATTSLLVQNSAANTSLQVTDDQQVTGYDGTQIRFRLGNTTYGQGISVRDGQFAVGFIDADQNSAMRFLTLGTGATYIDGYSEGTSKAVNYPLFIGSRTNNTGVSVTGSTTEENGTRVIFGSAVSDASAVVQVNSTTRGFLPPRMTTTEKNAIATPAAGLVVYDTTLNKLCVYTTAWETITSL